MSFEAAMKRWADSAGRSRTTASNILAHVKAVVGHAHSVGWIDTNPFAGRSIEHARSERAPWSDADLRRLFASPLFTAYELPTVSRAGLDAAYWLPLLGLFTGARITELAQLWTDDLTETPEAGAVILLREGKDRDQSLKNRASWRRVPVHPELVRLGLLDYWQAVSARGKGPLWPAVRWSKSNGAGGKVSQWFGEFKTEQGFGPEHVFHSFRHTVRTRLAAAGMPEAHIDGITGHAGSGEGRRTYTHLDASHLRPSLERLEYRGLALPRVFNAPGWRPAKT
jgi:integrase